MKSIMTIYIPATPEVEAGGSHSPGVLTSVWTTARYHLRYKRKKSHHHQQKTEIVLSTHTKLNSSSFGVVGLGRIKIAGTENPSRLW